MASRTVNSLAALCESTEAMLQSIADLTDNGARGASLLESWTIRYGAEDREGHLPQLGAWR
jgi:hypothetical protein